MKVLLVNPGENFRMVTTYIPLGIAYIGAVLRKHGIEVRAMDLRFYSSWEDFERDVEGFKPDIIGISSMTIDHDRALQAASIGKKCGALVILGGPHATVVPETVIAEPDVDVVVVGEGEYTMLELVRAYSKREDFSGIKGIYHKNETGIRINHPRNPVANLDELPYPARDLFPLDKILRTPATNFPLSSPALHIMTSRGCYYDCNFCQPCLSKIFGKEVRRRSIENVFGEIEFIYQNYGIRSLIIEDDTFTSKKGYVISLCKEMIARGLHKKISWYCHSRANTLDEELVDIMKASGCRSICFGIESGSQRVLDLLNKRTTVEQGTNSIKLCKQKGIIAVVNMMIGSPDEEPEDLQKSLDFINSVKPEVVYVGITTPTPGTFLYDYARDKGLLLAVNWRDFDRGKAGGKMKTKVDTDTLLEIRKKMARYGFSYSFIFEPHYMRCCITRWKSFISIGQSKAVLKEIIQPLRRA